MIRDPQLLVPLHDVEYDVPPVETACHGNVTEETKRLLPLLIEADCLEQRLSRMRANTAALSLVYWGSQSAISASLDLVAVANQMRRLRAPYRLTICGVGSLAKEIRHRIDELSLWSYLSLQPPMDFATGLIPLLQHEADIFLCCRSSGRPFTYAAALACGVPIAGYPNEDLKQLFSTVDVGWTSATCSPRPLAQVLDLIVKDRAVIEAKSRSAYRFAADISQMT